MAEEFKEADLPRHQRDQMLRLVTKSFYRELTNFGVNEKEVLRVASHLLDNLMSAASPSERDTQFYTDIFDITAIQDDWEEAGEISVQGVMLRPLQPATVPMVADWLKPPEVRESFVPAFPDDLSELHGRLFQPTSRFFEVVYGQDPVGIVGGEHINECDGKVEMKKLVGAPGLQGKGIGKRATFGFLFFAFMVMGMNKVYINSRDINMRNINLNSRFGFEIEGLFYEDLMLGGVRRDVVRMGLLKDTWLNIFSPSD